ncbi:gas vesicle protein GvpC [Bacillus licheniformis]|nr:gas vesicle protein GvpC [Bacillus licheniformis]
MCLVIVRVKDTEEFLQVTSQKRTPKEENRV